MQTSYCYMFGMHKTIIARIENFQVLVYVGRYTLKLIHFIITTIKCFNDNNAMIFVYIEFIVTVFNLCWIVVFFLFILLGLGSNYIVIFYRSKKIFLNKITFWYEIQVENDVVFHLFVFNFRFNGWK